jgi:integrase/recombinase XerC
MRLKGIRKDAHGIRAYVRVGSVQKEKRFPFETPLKTIHAWRDETRVTLRKGQPAKIGSGTIAADVARYLLQVKSMPTYAQRADHLALWLAALGPHTLRSVLTPDRIREVLHAWRGSGLSAATCNKRRSALMHLFSVLDGKDARNPVRAVPKFQVTDPMPRGRDPHVIDAALLKAPICRTRACARVMLWTGMRPVELARAKPEDVDLERRIVIVRTAKGGRVRVVPLTDQGIDAWREFAAAGCWEEPDNSTPTKKRNQPRKHLQKRIPDMAPMGRLLKQWTGMPDLRIYDLRHSYGTALARAQTRLDVIGSLMGHSTLDLTRRYTLAAVTPDALEATKRLGVKRG